MPVKRKTAPASANAAAPTAKIKRTKAAPAATATAATAVTANKSNDRGGGGGGGTSAQAATRSSLIGDRPKKLFEVLTALLADFAYDVLSIIASYDRECVILFIDESSDFTVWSLDENQYIIQPLNERRAGISPAAASDDLEVESIACSPLPKSSVADGSGSSGGSGGGFVWMKAIGTFTHFPLRLYAATQPLHYELISQRATTPGEFASDFWEAGHAAAICHLPRNRIMVAANYSVFTAEDGEEERNDFFVFSCTGGATAAHKPEIIRTTNPELELSTRGLRNMIELYKEYDGAGVTPRPDQAKTIARLTKLVQSRQASTHTPPKLPLEPAMPIPVTYLLPFPAPFEHVVLWVGSHDPDVSLFGAYDTERRVELIAPKPQSVDEEDDEPMLYISEEVLIAQWLITPAAPPATGYHLTLVIVSSEGHMFSITNEMMLPSTYAADSTAATVKAKTATGSGSDSDDDGDAQHPLVAWCRSATVELAGVDVPPVSQTFFADGTARLLYGGDSDAVLHRCTPQYTAATNKFRVQKETLRREPLTTRERKLPIDDICILDENRIAVISQSRIRIWDLASQNGDPKREVSSVELNRTGAARTKRIVHCLAL